MRGPAMIASSSVAQQSFSLEPEGDALSNALPLARLAKLVYAGDLEPGSQTQIKQFPERPLLNEAFPTLRRFSEGRAEGFVAANEADVIVAIRGHREPDRWMDSIAQGHIAAYGGRVSKGFHENATAIWDSVLAAFFDANVGNKNLWLTGHSIGGATAAVLAAELSAEGFNISAVYTFGAPAVFDANAADAFEPALHRFVNDGDWIPETQWPRLTRKYVHVGTRHFLLRSGAVGSGRYPDHLARRVDRFLNIEAPMVQSGFTEDHRMDEYLRRLRLLREPNCR